MMMRLHLAYKTVFIILMASLSATAQQTSQFSQYMFNGLVINPAYAGVDEALSITAYNRSQWSGLDGAPSTQSLSAHTLLARHRIGTGFSVVNDRIGVHQNLNVAGAAAYHLPVSASGVLSFGIQASYAHRESDYQSLGANYSGDPRIASTTINQNMIDFGAGVYFRSRRAHIGASLPQMLPGKLALNDTLTVKLSRRQGFLFSKISFDLSPTVAIEPGFLVKYFPGLPLSYDLNTNFIFHKVLITGISYRKKESVDFLLRAQVTPQLQLGYGYDHTIGDVSGLSGASHELMVNYLFRFTRSNVTSPR